MSKIQQYKRLRTVLAMLLIVSLLFNSIPSSGFVLADEVLEAEASQYIVTFVDYDAAVLKSETVSAGGYATAPTAPVRENYTFTGWDRDLGPVIEDVTIIAQYRENEKEEKKEEEKGVPRAAASPARAGEEGKSGAGEGALDAGEPVAVYTVTFKAWDRVLEIQSVEAGQNATPPQGVDVLEGFEFVSWDTDYTNVQQDLTVTAIFKPLETATIRIDYVYAGGGVAADPYIATYVKGVTVTDDPVISPVISGFDADETSVDITGQLDADKEFTVTYSPTSGILYTVKTYYQKLDGSYGTEANVTEKLYGEAGSTVTVPAPGEPGFYAPEAQEAVISGDGTTVVELRYERASYVLTFDTGEGEYIPPALVKYGAPIVKPANPSWIGYTFNGWRETPTASNTVTVAATMPADHLTYYAKWTGRNVNYTVVYWLEKPNFSGNPGSDPANYIYNKSVVKSGAAGTSVDGSNVSGGLGSISYAEYSHSDTKPIAGDGTTVLNVYFKRTIYTISFNLNRNNSDTTMKIGGTTYWGNSTTLYSINAKYEQDISGVWPVAPTATFSRSGYSFHKWTNTPNGTDWLTKRLTLTSDMIPQSGTTYTLKAAWIQSAIDRTVNYWFEQLPGTTGGTTKTYNGKTYVKSDLYSQPLSQPKSNGLNAKDINGMKHVGDDHDQEWSWLPLGYVVTAYNFFYDRNQYNLSFNTVGGSPIPAVNNILFEASISGYRPSDPTRDGYTFGGWYYDAEYNRPFSFAGATMPNADLALFAKWKAAEYTVTFDSGGGSSVAPQLVESGKKVIEPADPTLANHTFAGWYADQALTTPWIFNNQITQNTTLYAKWIQGETVDFTVNYKDENGNPLLASETGSGRVGSVVRRTAAVIDGRLPNLAFQSMTLSASGANVINFVYRPFTEVGYTVRYVDAAEPTKELSLQKTATTIDAVITEEFRAIGGYVPVKTQQTYYLSYDESLNVFLFPYNKCADKPYTVQHYFENKSGSYVRDDGKTQSLLGPVGANVTAEPLTVAGYLRNANVAPQSASGIVTSDGRLVLRLYYDLVKYQIDYAGLEGAAFDGSATNPNPAVYTVLTDTFTLANPEKTGHTFAGWAGTGDSGTSTSVTVTEGSTGDRSYIAQWDLNQYSVTFKAGEGGTINGGTADVVVQNVDHGTLWNDTWVPTPAPNEGYTFDKWEPSFPGTVTGSKTYTATFKLKQYDVTFSAGEGGTINGGTADVVIQNVDHGTLWNDTWVPTPAPNEGYTFDKWEPSFPGTVTGSKTYTATFKLKQYDVTFSAGAGGTINGGTADVVVQNVNHGTLWNSAWVPTPKANEGYYFAGWTPEFPETVTGALTFTANFTSKTVITLTAENAERTYTGAEQMVATGYTGVPAGLTISGLTASGKGTNVGNHDIEIHGTALIKNGAGTDVTNQYTIVRENGTLTINKKAITVTADNKSKTYGEGDPELTATVSGLVGSSPLLYTLERVPGESVGTYDITVTLGDNPNYDVTATNGTLTITKKAITVTADNKSKTYGEGDPELTATVSGVVGSDALDYTLGRAPGEGAGTYDITVTLGDNPNYDLSILPGALTIGQKAATITVDNKSKSAGTADPAFTAVVMGLVGADTLHYTLGRVAGETAGSYEINAALGLNPNYLISVVPGMLTITAVGGATVDEGDEDEGTAPGGGTVTPTPDADPDPGDDGEIIDIEDPETPLDNTGAWALLNLLLAIATFLAMIALLVGYFTARKKREEEEQAGYAAEEEDAEETKKKGFWRLISIIPGIGAPIVFLLTEDMSLPMAFIDKWTLLMAVIAVVQLLVMLKAKKKKTDRDADRNTPAPSQA